MLTEAHVISSVKDFLEASRFRVLRTRSELEQGIDIEALAPNGEVVSVEAKGETSSKLGTARFGKPFSANQVFDHVAKAFYCAARDCSTGMMAGIALPRNRAHVNCVQKVLPALKKLKIEVFWVRSNGVVSTERIWLQFGHEQQT